MGRVGEVRRGGWVCCPNRAGCSPFAQIPLHRAAAPLRGNIGFLQLFFSGAAIHTIGASPTPLLASPALPPGLNKPAVPWGPQVWGLSKRIFQPAADAEDGSDARAAGPGGGGGGADLWDDDEEQLVRRRRYPSPRPMPVTTTRRGATPARLCPLPGHRKQGRGGTRTVLPGASAPHGCWPDATAVPLPSLVRPIPEPLSWPCVDPLPVDASSGGGGGAEAAVEVGQALRSGSESDSEGRDGAPLLHHPPHSSSTGGFQLAARGAATCPVLPDAGWARLSSLPCPGLPRPVLPT